MTRLVNDTLDTVLLLALPASGKSEVRRYLASLDPDQCRNEMHLGSTLQLDDYPYVHLMHRIDDEVVRLGGESIFYLGPTRPFRDPFEWGTLIELLNEDYDDLLNRRTASPTSAAELLFERLDAAHDKVGLGRALERLPHRVWKAAARALERECAEELERKNETVTQDRTGRTIVIEAARGGPNGATFPLTPPRGYGYSLTTFSDAILERASILYVRVSPEESRRKNQERGRPDGQGSILFHAVPLEVMLGEYGCDDMDFLVSRSDRPNTVRLEKLGVTTAADGTPRYVQREYHLPIGLFDNTADLTTFVREPRDQWPEPARKRLHDGLAGAFAAVASAARGEHGRGHG